MRPLQAIALLIFIVACINIFIVQIYLPSRRAPYETRGDAVDSPLSSIAALNDADEPSISHDTDWKAVPERRLVLKSAYVVSGEQMVVRILANKNCLEKRTVSCRFHSYFFPNSDLVLAEYDLINTPDDVDCNTDVYKAYFVNCVLPMTSSSIALLRPAKVSVFASDSSEQAVAPRIDISYVSRRPLQLAFCVSPLVGWNDTYRLALFIEYYIHQGGEYFVMYRHSTSEEIDRLLREYQKRGLVEVVPYSHMPPTLDNTEDPNSKVHYYGQILSMNDCLFRLRGRAQFVALLDVDEFIVPTSMDKTVLSILLEVDQPSIGGFMFLSSFVYVNLAFTGDFWNIMEFKRVFDFSQTRVLRETRVYPPGVHSKMIVKPIGVLKQTVHSVWKYAEGYDVKVIPTSTALLYHLRQTVPNEDASDGVVEDTHFSGLLKTIFTFNGVQ